MHHAAQAANVWVRMRAGLEGWAGEKFVLSCTACASEVCSNRIASGFIALGPWQHGSRVSFCRPDFYIFSRICYGVLATIGDVASLGAVGFYVGGRKCLGGQDVLLTTRVSLFHVGAVLLQNGTFTRGGRHSGRRVREQLICPLRFSDA